jgi:hypothetical protein
MTPTVTCEKPLLPTLWLDTSVVIKLAKIKKGEALQKIEIERCNRLHDLVYRLVREAKLLCPESDQEEEYAAFRLDDDVHSMFARLSLGISLTHRQGILDNHIFKGMEAFVRGSDTILLPTRSYFHGDPVRQLHEACGKRFIVTVGPLKNSEMLQRRARAKEAISRDWENLRQRLVAEGQTYERQVDKEVYGHWSGTVELVKKFEANLIAGRHDFWDFMGASGALLYRTVWNELGGEPRDWVGLDGFFRSPCFSELPGPYIGARLCAALVTGNEAIKTGDAMDVDLLEIALPVAHYVLTDHRMALRIRELGLDTKCNAQVFSMQTIDGLFAELEKIQ